MFLDASVEERAARRIAERGLDPVGDEAELVREQLRRRDDQDRNRAVAPLRAADDAVHVRTDGNTFEQTVDLVVAAIATAEERRAASPARPAREGPAAPAADPEPKARPNKVLEAAYRMDNDKSLLVRLVALACRIGSRLFARVRVEGMENVPRKGAVILAVNHISNADPLVVGSWITDALARRRIHWLGKRELFDWPVFGWIAANGGVHPVDRGTADVEAFRLATKILEAGYVLLVFPEGTRSPTGELQEAKDGLAALALRTGAQEPTTSGSAFEMWFTARMTAPLRGTFSMPSTRTRAKSRDPIRHARATRRTSSDLSLSMR